MVIKMFNHPIDETMRHIKLALKHPTAALRYIFRNYMWLNTLRITHTQVRNLYAELYEKHDVLIGLFEKEFNTFISKKRQPELYVICRLLKPDVVVETGVEHGISSAFILLALEENGQGTLYSIDITETLSSKIKTGWLVPEHLRHKWRLTIGNSLNILPRLLQTISPIDIFLHDSEHTYSVMMNEYDISWPYIKAGGLLLSDDTGRNEAFIDFCIKMKRKPLWTEKEYGMIVKF